MGLNILNISGLAILAILTVGSNVMGAALPSDITERAAAITLGAASTYGISAATTVTNGGLSVITGSLGVCPGSAITGFPPGTITGVKSLNLAPGCAASAGCLSAFNAATALKATKALASSNLNGQTLTAGVYTFPSSGVTNSGVLTLSGTGQFVFHIATTLTTSALSSIKLENGATAANVFFILGSSATLGASSSFSGNVLAHTSISLGGLAKVSGTLCAITGAVTLSENSITA